jgi:uncharacterized protein (TIGR03083 family)
VEINAHIDQLDAEGLALAAAAQQADLDAAVEHCPDWTVRDVVTHVGGVHRWAAEIVGEALLDLDEVTAEAVGTGPADSDLLGWFVEGHAALVSTLRAAPLDLQCFSFLAAPSPLAFWARRQALETAVHRVDVESPSGRIGLIDQSLALDGIDELLVGFGARRRTFEPGLIRLEPAGGSPWDVMLGADGLTAVPSASDARPADVTVAGAASDVYLWLWNRPAAISISGDTAIADQWQNVRVRWS